MQKFRRRGLIAAAGLAVLAAAAPNARAVVDPPGYQATEKDYKVERFSDASIDINNKFLPVIPGSTFTLTGTANRGAGQNPHTVIFTVTEVTKMVNGVRTVVLWDRDIQEGVLVEEELAFWAQDDSGNVWLMGEYPEEHEGNKVSAPAAWLTGIQQATAGILMRFAPAINTTQYEQGKAPKAGFHDLAKVFAENQHTCIDLGCFDGVLVVDEWDPDHQPEDGHQFKYHAPGVGIIQVTARGGDEQETLVATEHRTLTPEELAAANQRALELDSLAYTRAKAVYTGSPPATVVTRCVTPAPGSPTTSTLATTTTTAPACRPQTTTTVTAGMVPPSTETTATSTTQTTPAV
jgi:hypothetical protein